MKIKSVSLGEQSLETILEVDLVDKLGMKGVVDLLAEIANGKASHLEENWQDFKTAESWIKIAKILDETSSKLV